MYFVAVGKSPASISAKNIRCGIQAKVVFQIDYRPVPGIGIEPDVSVVIRDEGARRDGEFFVKRLTGNFCHCNAAG